MRAEAALMTASVLLASALMANFGMSRAKGANEDAAKERKAVEQAVELDGGNEANLLDTLAVAYRMTRDLAEDEATERAAAAERDRPVRGFKDPRDLPEYASGRTT